MNLNHAQDLRSTRRNESIQSGLQESASELLRVYPRLVSVSVDVTGVENRVRVLTAPSAATRYAGMRTTVAIWTPAPLSVPATASREFA